MVIEQLVKLGLTKTDLARGMGVSQDYVYRFLNGRATFPRARETLERIATICQLDPFIFAEYRQRTEQLSVSTRLLWERMRERGLGREDLYMALGGRISRPYFNSILRGDQPFPTNRSYVQLFALALDLPPTAFPEFGQVVPVRWPAEALLDAEQQCFELFFDKMMADCGFSRHAVTFSFLDPLWALRCFPARNKLTPPILEVLTRMGELGMGFRELTKVCGVPRNELAQLFTTADPGPAAASNLAAVRLALRLT